MNKRITSVIIVSTILVSISIANVTFGEKRSEAGISFHQSGNFIKKMINDQKSTTQTIEIEFLDKKGNRINPNKEIRLKKGSYYDLMNNHR